MTDQFEQLKELLAQLEEGAIEHPVDTAESVLEALELAALIDLYENEALSLLSQSAANLLERVKDQELESPELHRLVYKLREVGYDDPEIMTLLALEHLDSTSDSTTESM